jgi:NAD(P)-dependent dehydrogenase (short-subunit alcohol dehydrogenase family)
MSKHLYILSGASRGMGLAMAQQLLAPQHDLICISRRANADLATQAAAQGAMLEQWPLDLEQAADAAQQLGQWLMAKSGQDYASATLINNAGVLPQVGPLRRGDSADLARALRVDLEAPMLLTAIFLGATQAWQNERRVLNISSGLGRRAMASQAAYCAAKAGMDHFTRCLALEEALVPHGAKVCSLAPGVIDTDMQAQLRQAPGQYFPDQASFVYLKTQNQLTTPEQAATRVLAYLARPDFGCNPVADVRDEQKAAAPAPRP